MAHTEKHRLAGQVAVVQLGNGVGIQYLTNGSTVNVMDWWDHLPGNTSWMEDGRWPGAYYGRRREEAGLPLDNEVIYVKCQGFGYLVHESELQEIGSKAGGKVGRQSKARR